MISYIEPDRQQVAFSLPHPCRNGRRLVRNEIFASFGFGASITDAQVDGGTDSNTPHAGEEWPTCGPAEDAFWHGLTLPDNSCGVGILEEPVSELDRGELDGFTRSIVEHIGEWDPFNNLGPSPMS